MKPRDMFDCRGHRYLIDVSISDEMLKALNEVGKDMSKEVLKELKQQQRDNNNDNRTS